MSLQEEWEKLWDAFYKSKADQASINEKLVECKNRMRSAGMNPRQPAAPRPKK